jgi:hypothetical protein
MARFGGKKYGLDQQAKGAAWYGLTEENLRWAWEQYQRGVRAHVIVGSLQHRCHDKRPISIRKLTVEWGALGYPVWDFGRRRKMRDVTGQLLEHLQDKFDMTQPSVMYGALAHALDQGVDLRAILEGDFGQPTKRPKRWLQKTPVGQVAERFARALAERQLTFEDIEPLLDGVKRSRAAGGKT